MNGWVLFSIIFYCFIKHACYEANKKVIEKDKQKFREYQKKWEEQKAFEEYKKSPEYEAYLVKKRKEDKELKQRSRQIRKEYENKRRTNYYKRRKI